MANYLRITYAKSSQDPTPGSPTLEPNMGFTLLFLSFNLGPEAENQAVGEIDLYGDGDDDIDEDEDDDDEDDDDDDDDDGNSGNGGKYGDCDDVY
ncbi:hypothetical protein PoB_000203100 [Plakobranchus ocellatus]|uniref:Uncharacterized protein n=1 Tax=Plakobranchus ocellatus TaxID=259542 RepID=A0AAV3XXH5_9GAST|nr:hypothetical protein PoB_000203100 [Plakobranchus ocellatus]